MTGGIQVAYTTYWRYVLALQPNLISQFPFVTINFAFIHSVVCLTTGPQPLPNRVLYRLRSSASSSNIQYPFFSFRSCNSCLHLLSRLLVVFFCISFNNMFQKTVPTQDVTNPVSLPLFFVGYSSPPRLFVTLPHFSHDRSN